ncbi:MAG: hypothetical protein WCT14_12265 [Treponemataceae bacterium]
MIKPFFRLAVAVGVAILSLTLLSCPQPITQAHADSARDATPPVVTVSSPVEYASFSRNIVIDGTVSDLAASGRSGRVDTLTYEILSHTSAKAATIGANGSFHIDETNDLRENIVILLKATDWNGNATEYRLPLTFPGNEIPSFSSIESNREVVLKWNAVPGVQSYRLYFESSAKTPDPATSIAINGISSPYTLNQLKNGTLYSFLLEGTTSDGKKNYSAVVRSVPLSSLHLFPRATSYFNGIELTWRTFPAIQNYEVLRAVSPAGPWESVSGPVASPPFRDSSVSQGTTYYYAVKPASYSAVVSEWVEAQADPTASRSDASVAAYDGVDSANSSVWNNGYLYVADYYYGLRVLDVSNPSYPREAGKVAISSARDIFLQGDYAYVTGWKSLYIVDITAPSTPRIVGSVELSAGSGFQAQGVSVLGDLAFVAGFNEGFAVVDVTNKTAPVVRLSDQDAVVFGQNYETAVQDRGSSKILAVAGNSASALYTITGTAAVPTVTRVSSAISWAKSFTFSGTILYAASGWDVATYQTSTPAAPTLLDTIDVTGAVAAPESVVLSGTRVFAALRNYGYAVVDASNPAGLSVVRVQTVPGEGLHVEVGGGYAYVSAGQGYGLPIYGANDPSAAKLIKTLTDVSSGARIAAYRGYLYISEFSADWSAASYDISVPASTYRYNGNIGSYTPYDFAFAGARSYLAAERSGVMMWNAAVPGAPTVLPPWYVSLPGGYAWAIALTGNYALLGTSNSSFVSVDLSRSDSLTVVGTVQTQGTISATYEIRGLAVKGNLAFAANELGGVCVVDLTDPAFPFALNGYGAMPASGSAAAVAVAGEFVLIADSTNGLLVYDAANARSWSAAGEARVWPTSVSGVGATDVVVRGNYAYVAKPTVGLEIWDISNPRVPTSAGTLTSSGFNPTRLALYGEYLYAIDGATKLYVVDLVP